jgi:CheY-like chemotaxis protein
MKKILIIEDDQVVATIYRNKLAAEGFITEVVYDGEMALELCNKFVPDLIVLDLILPKMTGTELLKKVRATAGFENTPVIVFSNTYLTNMVQEAWKAGATKCLSKASCTPKQLIEVVRSLLGESGEVAAPPSTIPPVPSQTAQPAPAPAAVKTDTEQFAALKEKFSRELPSTLGALRSSHQGIAKAENDGARLAQVQELYKRVHTLTGTAAACGMATIALMSDALEALLRELTEKPHNINVSTLRTVAAAIDFLGILFEHASRSGAQETPSAKVLVVDDEAISRRAIVHALEKVKLKSTESEAPENAYDLIIQHRFDLVFLDVDMPGMNGFELCTKIRALPAYKKTPVVFVTGLTDFESRASSMMSGGNDFIGKPFLFMELAVKALVYVLRAKLDSAGR